MGNVEVLRNRYAELNTDALLDLWLTEDRLPWAESVLREELASRGISETELEVGISRRADPDRSRPPQVRDTIGLYGVLGRAGAIFVAVCIGNLVGSLLGAKAAFIAVTIVAAIYVAILYRRVHMQFKSPAGGWGGVFMVWQCIEAGLILLALIVGCIMFLGRGT